MNFVKNSGSFQKFPMILFDKSGTVTYKNRAFEQICNIKLKSKADKIFSPDIIKKFSHAVQNACIDTVECNEFEGYCAVLIVPSSLFENAVVFIPSYYEGTLQGDKCEIIELICKQLTAGNASEEISKNLARVRGAVYRDFKRLDDTFTHCIDISKLAEFTAAQLRVCTFPLGIKLHIQIHTEKRLLLQTDVRVLATQLLCMFDIALYLNKDKCIDFNVSYGFNKAYFEFECNTDKEELDESMCLEKYILGNVSKNDGHRFDFSIKDGKAKCTLALPLTNKFEFSIQDEHWAEAVFCDAIKF